MKALYKIAASLMTVYLLLLTLGAVDFPEAGNPYHLPLFVVLFYFYEPF
ncbi:MAG: hypothetical protein AAFQ01_00330 [Bacteroidota bacterium]